MTRRRERFRKEPAKEPEHFWTTKQGERIAISQVSNRHMLNIIAWIRVHGVKERFPDSVPEKLGADLLVQLKTCRSAVLVFLLWTLVMREMNGVVVPDTPRVHGIIYSHRHQQMADWYYDDQNYGD